MNLQEEKELKVVVHGWWWRREDLVAAKVHLFLSICNEAQTNRVI